MGDLISRSALIDWIDAGHLRHPSELCYSEMDVVNMLLHFPTVEAEPVVHGEWIEHRWAEEFGGCLISDYECSRCHTWERENSDYCPNCGADMRGL